MGDYKNINSFVKAFKKAVPNFNDDKVQFHPAGSYGGGEVNVVILVRGKLTNMLMYRSDFEITQWANHFIDFFNTGTFDRHVYVSPYKSSRETPEALIKKLPLCKKGEGVYGKICDYQEHSPTQSKWFNEYRKEYGDCGFTTVPKPLTD